MKQTFPIFNGGAPATGTTVLDPVKDPQQTVFAYPWAWQLYSELSVGQVVNFD